jgi:hypothetical protein
MSNCVYIQKGDQIVLTAADIDVGAFRKAIENCEEESTPWWYLGATTFKGSTVILNLNGDNRSGFTFRSLYATLLWVGKFMKRRKRISFVMSQEDETVGVFRKHYYIGKFTGSEVVFRIEEFKSSSIFDGPLCWHCTIMEGCNKIGESYDTSYISPLHALSMAINNLLGETHTIPEGRRTFKQKELRFTPTKSMISINGGPPVECEGSTMEVLDKDAPFVQNAPFPENAPTPRLFDTLDNKICQHLRTKQGLKYDQAITLGRGDRDGFEAFWPKIDAAEYAIDEAYRKMKEARARHPIAYKRWINRNR